MNSKTETIRYDISVLLATRGRTDALRRSVNSLLDNATRSDRLQLLFAFDRDDDRGLNFFQDTYKQELEQRRANFAAMVFDRMGYTGLHRYSNSLARHAPAHWLMIWNDDAVMQTLGWDLEIMHWQGQFRLLSVHTHRDHPYSIFPIVPRAWFDLLGYISPHPSQDAWVSQQAYMLDIYERIPVWVMHDRFDLTGNNQDSTYQERVIMEGRPHQPGDYHHRDMQELRMQDCHRLAKLLKHQYHHDVTFWENIMNGQQDPWVKLKANDINGQMVQFRNPYTHFAAHTQSTSEPEGA
jgi:hypothetical protein